MKNLPTTNTNSSTNSVSINVIPSDFKYLEITQTTGSETTISLSPTNGIIISHKTGNKLALLGQK